MAQFNRLVSRSEFSRVYKNGRSVADKILVLYYLPNLKGHTRFGFTVGKKIGKAVTRNRYKRILREICRINIQLVLDGYDCVLIARPGIVEENYKTIEKSFIKLVKKARLNATERKYDEAPGSSGN